MRLFEFEFGQNGGEQEFDLDECKTHAHTDTWSGTERTERDAITGFPLRFVEAFRSKAIGLGIELRIVVQCVDGNSNDLF